MRLLLDTHVMFWWLRDDPRLATRTKALIADPQAEMLVSIASFWELSLKARLGKAPESGAKLLAEARRGGLAVIDIALSHLEALELQELRPEHKDPFDHLIMAQAVAEQAVLVTGDRKLLAYDIRAVRAQ